MSALVTGLTRWKQTTALTQSRTALRHTNRLKFRW